MKSMKLTAAERKASSDGSCLASLDGKKPEYPGGLRLNLDEPTMKKLGIEIEGMQLGRVLEIKAMAKICGLSESRWGPLELQITDIEVVSDSDGEFRRAFNERAGNGRAKTK